ncbi:MAG: hypothetical protein J6R85_03965 [Lentisphaeria bacterium]|nr:hypothetical protein [Lentisphaeria bacterium]
MVRYLVYFFPVAVNYILGGMFFISALRFSEADAGGLAVGASIAAWALPYALISLWIGSKTTMQNARQLIIGAALALALISLGFRFFDGLYLQFLWIVLTGIASGVYCVPFQVFMKSIDPDPSAGIVRASSVYTFAWSFGLATGPFIFRQIPMQTGYCVNAVLALMIALSVPAIEFWCRRHPAKAAAVRRDLPDYSGRPDLARLGWIVSGIGVLTVAMLRAMEPYRGEKLGFSMEEIGGALALVSYVQAFTALALIRSREWMYHPLPALLAGISGTAALLLFGLGEAVWCFYLGALLYGLYSGCFYFYIVFYSLVHPTKAGQYVGVNELIVGVVSVLGPVAGGLLVWDNQSSLPFLAASLLTAGATVFHFCKLRRCGKNI